MIMSEYEFTLKFAIPVDSDRESLETCLFEAGCDDALLGTGHKGRVALTFQRKASSGAKAVESALADVQRALPKARLVEAEPDLVGVSDIADLFAFSRQNMRKLLQTHTESFPLPLHEGRSSLWHLADVLDWFEQRQGRPVDPMLREVAGVNMQTNAAREVRRLDAADRASSSGDQARSDVPA
jgi:predicted DNA-binding transcriptional regulator AlpA